MTAQFFYKNAERQTFGPFTVDSLREEAQSGRLTKNDIVWLGGTNKQYKAADVKGLFKAAEPQRQVASVHPSIVPADILTTVPPEAANMATQDTVEQIITVNSTGPSDERRATVSKRNSSSSELYRIQNDGLLIKKRAYDRDLYEAGALAEIFTHFLAEEDQKGTINGRPTAWVPATNLESVYTHGHTYKTLPVNKSNYIASLLLFGSLLLILLSIIFIFVHKNFGVGLICFLLAFAILTPTYFIWTKLAKSGLDWHVQLNTNDGQQFLFPFATEEDAEVSRRELDALIN